MLRIQGGNDIFCSLGGHYAPSFFGVSPTALALLPRPAPFPILSELKICVCTDRSLCMPLEMLAEHSSAIKAPVKLGKSKEGPLSQCRPLVQSEPPAEAAREAGGNLGGLALPATHASSSKDDEVHSGGDGQFWSPMSSVNGSPRAGEPLRVLRHHSHTVFKPHH